MRPLSVIRGVLLGTAVGCAVWTCTATLVLTAAQMTLPEWTDRRLSVLEAQNLHGRLLVIESDVNEIKFLQRTVTVALIGQFAAVGWGALKRRKLDP